MGNFPYSLVLNLGGLEFVNFPLFEFCLVHKMRAGPNRGKKPKDCVEPEISKQTHTQNTHSHAKKNHIHTHAVREKKQPTQTNKKQQTKDEHNLVPMMTTFVFGFFCFVFVVLLYCFDFVLTLLIVVDCCTLSFFVSLF